ncbi:MAG: sugar ABC transporter substrate-binding protein, partial [Clostridiales bacterium]|nr:sugar ABC transporter substrate-binding protein [Clostridiales bacterium]
GLVKAFQQSYPNVTVEVQETSGDGAYLTKLVSQLASGTAPDIIATENGMMAKFVDSGLLMPITRMLEADADVNVNDYFPHLLNYYTVDGEIYGLPYDAQPISMFFYNKALFDEAGVAYPTEDWTWDDMRDAAIKLTKTDDGGRITQYGLLANTWKNYLYSNGGAIMDDLYAPTACVINSPEAIEAIQFMADLILVDKVMPSPDTLSTSGVSGPDMFATGQIAMFNTGYWSLVDLPDRWKDIDLGLTMVPKANGGGRAVSTGGTAYCVANGSANPELAYEFVKYFMGMQGWEAAYAAATRGIIYPPAYIPAYEKLILKNPDLTIPNIDVNGRSIEFATFNPRIPLYGEMESKVITPTMEEIMLGITGVEDGLNDIADRLNAALATGEVD